MTGGTRVCPAGRGGIADAAVGTLMSCGREFLITAGAGETNRGRPRTDGADRNTFAGGIGVLD